MTESHIRPISYTTHTFTKVGVVAAGKKDSGRLIYRWMGKRIDGSGDDYKMLTMFFDTQDEADGWIDRRNKNELLGVMAY